MGLLFCVALVLALPTMGISLLAWIALAIFKARNEAGAMHSGGSARPLGNGGNLDVGGPRRNRIIEGYLQQMADSGTSELDVPSLYFEAACRYAQDHGGVLYEDMRNSIIFDKVINGRNYSVFFHVGRNGNGTNISVTQRRSSLEIAEEEADAFVDRAKRKQTLSAQYAPDEAERLKKAILLSSEDGGLVKGVEKSHQNHVEIFYLNHFFHINCIEEKYRSVTGRSGWVDFGGNVYLVATACIDDYIWVKTLPQPIPFAAALTITSEDYPRMEDSQRFWFNDFFTTMKNMTHSWPEYDHD